MNKFKTRSFQMKNLDLNVNANANANILNISKGENIVDPYRLPRDIIPKVYELKLVPDLDAATFSGEVNITLNVLKKTNTIILNSKQLNITSIHVNEKKEKNFELDSETERITIKTKNFLCTDTIAYLRIRFTGILNNDLAGFYRSTYTDSNGTKQIIATTQMEPSNCRRAFPCWDEPEFKAIYRITLVVNNDLTVISNSEEVYRIPTSNNKVIVSFADTIPMSTYLVAFIVGRFESTPTINVNGTLMRILHVPGKSNLTELGLRVGEFSLKWFENYFGIKYPGKKIDLVAIPDFSAGAMENFGCITFRETALLVDSNNSTQSQQIRVADVVSHENAHMWFGDLVTMKWWNGLWLNEAFATFMEIAACDAFKPEWNRWTSFSIERSTAFDVDSLESTRPVEFIVKTPDEADAMFDVLTYQKGGSLLRMLEMFMGKDRFRNGIRNYLIKYSYKNAETSDLWDSIEETLKNDMNNFIPIRNIMDSWIFQKGYPVIIVNIDTENNEIIFRQERFTFNKSNQVDPTLWSVPIHFRDSGEMNEKKILFNTREMHVKIVDSSKPIIINAGGFGYYRVAYSLGLFARFNPATISQMSNIERYILVDDAWNAVVANRISAIEYLNFIDNFSNERDISVWTIISKNFNRLQRILPNDKQILLKSRIMNLVKPAFNSITWTSQSNENNTIKELRSILITLMACNANDIETQQKAREIFNNAENGQFIDPEMLEAVTTIVSLIGGEIEFNLLKNKFKNVETPQEKIRALYALANFQSAELVKNACDFALSNEVRTQDAPSLIYFLIANRNYGNVAWDIIKTRWNEINQKYNSSFSSIIYAISSVSLLNTPQQFADVKDFFSKNPIQTSKQKLDQIIERQGVNVDLRIREETRLINALS